MDKHVLVYPECDEGRFPRETRHGTTPEDRPLTEISLAVGFSDQSHFTRVFVDVMGETPRGFRRRHR